MLDLSVNGRDGRDGAKGATGAQALLVRSAVLGLLDCCSGPSPWAVRVNCTRAGRGPGDGAK